MSNGTRITCGISGKQRELLGVLGAGVLGGRWGNDFNPDYFRNITHGAGPALGPVGLVPGRPGSGQGAAGPWGSCGSGRGVTMSLTPSSTHLPTSGPADETACVLPASMPVGRSSHTQAGLCDGPLAEPHR